VTTYSTVVEKDADSGDLYITFPPELITAMGWDDDPLLEWTQIDAERWQLKKAD